MATRVRGTSEVMFPLVACYLRGSKGPDAFCQEHGLSRNQLTYWRRKYAASSSASEVGAFVEVPSPQARERVLMEVEFPGGTRLRLFTPVSADFLGSVLQRVRSPSC